MNKISQLLLWDLDGREVGCLREDFESEGYIETWAEVERVYFQTFYIDFLHVLQLFRDSDGLK